MQLNKKKKIPLICKIFDPKCFFHDFVKWTGALPVVVYLRQKRHYINGKKQKKLFRGSAIIVSNHPGFFNPLIAMNAFWMKRCGFIATKDIFKNKFQKWLFTSFGCIEVDKTNVSVAMFKKTSDVLNRGHSIIVFPEGHVVREGNVQDFKSGAILMAMFADAPIIPMYIVKREKWWKRQHIVIGEKFNVKDYISSPIPSMEDIERVTKILREKELELENLGKEVINMIENPFKKYAPDVFNKIVLIDTVVDLLEKGKKEYSEKVAVKKDDEDITYNKLYQDVNNVCGALKNNNIEPLTNVGVISFNNYNFVKASLGAMAYGAVATLLPFQLDEKAIYGCSLKYNLKALFYDPAFEEKVAFAKNLLKDVKFIKIENFENVEENLFNKEIKKENRACIVLTGGTTGKSKGAILSHEALMMGTVNGMYADPNAFNHVYYSIMPLTHVFGLVRNLLTCLYSGSMIYFCSNMKEMFKEMQKLHPTILVAVPALAELFLNLVKQFGLNMLGGAVNTIICGGASVPPYLTIEFRKLGINFCPGYGLTELANLVSGNPAGDEKPSSVGLLYPHQETKLVNDELWIKGKNLMECYYNEEEENKSAFEDGWFKTGDLVRFDEDGYMYIIGRIKDIIVLSNGENVSPAHIESKVNELDFIQDSLVYKDKNNFGMDILVVEVLPRMSVLGKLNIEDPQKFIEEKIDELNKSLFDYERLSKVIIRKEDFARSPSMKIIRPKRDV